jgi:hypothetical protein
MFNFRKSSLRGSVHTYIHTYIHTHTHTYTHTHTDTIHVCIYIHIYMHTHIHIYTHVGLVLRPLLMPITNLRFLIHALFISVLISRAYSTNKITP